MRRATVNGGAPSSSFGNFYPRSPCGERPVKHTQIDKLDDFYPRSPCGERQSTTGIPRFNPPFLSTLSLRRATVEEVSGDTWARDFYPRSPCGERHDYGQYYIRAREISIHALLAESDHPIGVLVRIVKISIHALLAESDNDSTRRTYQLNEFLSTLSLRRATYWSGVLVVGRSISISRSPCGERLIEFREFLHPSYFYPRSPCGERPKKKKKTQPGKSFLSTLSLRRATREPTAFRTPHHKFLSTLSLRRAT